MKAFLRSWQMAGGALVLGVALALLATWAAGGSGKADAAESLRETLQRSQSHELEIPQGSVVHMVATQASAHREDDGARPDPYHLSPEVLFHRDVTVESWSLIGPEGTIVANRIVARDSSGEVVQEAIENESGTKLYDAAFASVVEFPPAEQQQPILGLDRNRLGLDGSNVAELGRDSEAEVETTVFRIADDSTTTELEVSSDGLLLRVSTIGPDGEVVEESRVEKVEILSSFNIPQELEHSASSVDLADFTLPPFTELSMEEAEANGVVSWLLTDELMRSLELEQPEVIVTGSPLDGVSIRALQNLTPFPFVQTGVASRTDYEGVDGLTYLAVFQGPNSEFSSVLAQTPPSWQRSERVRVETTTGTEVEGWLLVFSPLNAGDREEYGLIVALGDDLVLLTAQGLTREEVRALPSSLVEVRP